MGFRELFRPKPRVDQDPKPSGPTLLDRRMAGFKENSGSAAQPAGEPIKVLRQLEVNLALQGEVSKMTAILANAAKTIERPEELLDMIDRVMAANGSTEANRVFLNDVIEQLNQYNSARGGAVRPKDMPLTPLIPNFDIRYQDKMLTMPEALRSRHEQGQGTDQEVAAAG